MNGRHFWVTLVLTLLPIVATPVGAQGPPERRGEAERGELRQEMRKFFSDSLRADLGLTDEQAEQIMPQIQRLEQERGDARREREETTRALRDGVDQGADDDELQALLDRLDDSERRQLALRESAFAEIDRYLTVRQRVRLRFFMEGFPRMMREKIMELRGGRRPGWDRGDAPRHRSPGERP